eukprot:TRINITY_DN59149_c0_g1_i1.p1 TRINITY_DN59149_c0_g1~~TRINITY_DN59149_c0_g1_i1.p1  ORF type:complete len:109 (-),score=20.46 TRINITY_DN59149_c0_g1_i1:104-430(-)
MRRRPPRSTLSSSSAASDVYKRQVQDLEMKNACKLVSMSLSLPSWPPSSSCQAAPRAGIQVDLSSFQFYKVQRHQRVLSGTGHQCFRTSSFDQMCSCLLYTSPSPRDS